MPPKPQWYQRLPRILEELKTLELPVVDRATVEQLFGLRRRGAINLMGRFGGYQAGKTFLVDRRELIERLSQVEASHEYVVEHRRRQRLVEILEKTRREREAAEIVIPVEPDAYSRRMAELPAGVSLRPGHLSISFGAAEELLQKLFELAQAISNDMDSFRELAES